MTMKLNAVEILANSFVVSIDEERYRAFKNGFEKENLYPFPKKFLGYEIQESYFRRQFHSMRFLEKQDEPALIDFDVKLMKSLCNNASHFSIVQYASLSDLPFVTIFEDDAVPVKNCIEKLNFYCSDIPDEIDVLRLGYCAQYERPTSKRTIAASIPHADSLIVKNLGGSHAYIVFRRYYTKFLESNATAPRCDFEKINPTMDKNVFALRESLFNQSNLKDRPVIHSYKEAPMLLK